MFFKITFSYEFLFMERRFSPLQLHLNPFKSSEELTQSATTLSLPYYDWNIYIVHNGSTCQTVARSINVNIYWFIYITKGSMAFAEIVVIAVLCAGYSIFLKSVFVCIITLCYWNLANVVNMWTVPRWWCRNCVPLYFWKLDERERERKWVKTNFWKAVK